MRKEGRMISWVSKVVIDVETHDRLNDWSDAHSGPSLDRLAGITARYDTSGVFRSPSI
jgi:hypothetical protein